MFEHAAYMRYYIMDLIESITETQTLLFTLQQSIQKATFMKVVRNFILRFFLILLIAYINGIGYPQ